MVMLVAGVFSASLGLIYASIAVSILAALTLGAGVLLRRRELFGEAAAADTRPGGAAADAAGARSAGIRQAGLRPAPDGPVGAGQPAGAGQAADDRARPGRGGRADDGKHDGDLTDRPPKTASGAGSGSARWPGSIAAKGAAGSRAAGPIPGARAPAPHDPARGDRGRTERDRG